MARDEGKRLRTRLSRAARTAPVGGWFSEEKLRAEEALDAPPAQQPVVATAPPLDWDIDPAAVTIDVTATPDHR